MVFDLIKGESSRLATTRASLHVLLQPKTPGFKWLSWSHRQTDTSRSRVGLLETNALPNCCLKPLKHTTIESSCTIASSCPAKKQLLFPQDILNRPASGVFPPSPFKHTSSDTSLGWVLGHWMKSLKNRAYLDLCQLIKVKAGVQVRNCRRKQIHVP